MSLIYHNSKQTLKLNEYKISDCENIPISVTDIVAGWLYKRLINDYKEYDSQQKVYINSLIKRINELTEALREITTKGTFNIIKRYETNRELINQCKNKIEKLKDINERLLCENIRLKQQIGCEDAEFTSKTYCGQDANH